MSATSEKKRQNLRVILKIMAWLGVILLFAVLLNSLFIGEQRKPKEQIAEQVEPLTVDVSRMAPGDVKLLRWNRQQIGILMRTPDFERYLSEYSKQQQFDEALPEGFDSQLRSKYKKYFVYINQGDSGRCPLHFNGRYFKDTCSGSLFDQAGRSIGKELKRMIQLPDSNGLSFEGMK